MRDDGRIGWQTLRVNYGSKSSIKVNYDPAANDPRKGREKKMEKRGVEEGKRSVFC